MEITLDLLSHLEITPRLLRATVSLLIAAGAGLTAPALDSGTPLHQAAPEPDSMCRMSSTRAGAFEKGEW